MVNKGYHQLFIFLVLTLLLSGCWDEIELEDRAFVSGIGIDLVESQGQNNIFELTDQLVVPAGLGSPTELSGEKAYRNLTQRGDSLFEINAKISKQANRVLNPDHLEVIIFSKEVVEKENLVADLLDAFLRHQNMRRGVLLAIAEGKAKDLLYVETEHAKLPAQYLSELLVNREIPETIEPIRIGDVHEKILNNRSFILPELAVYADNSVNYQGIAIFQGVSKKLVDTITGDEAKGLNFIRGENQEGSITADVEGKKTTFSVLEGGSKIKLTNKDKNNLSFQVDIEATVQIAEYFGEIDFYKKENKAKFDKALKDKLTKAAEDAVKKVKDELQVDVFKFDEYLRMHHYKLWEVIKEDWDHGENYFANSDLNINVKATVREPGNTIRIKQDGGGK
ncbi:Ger(x)C family spore germination protein [Ornithinibacillus sp. L9]|uniref:Ger(X)C family spore germination protein n=1 Tax=Ornithinibacillus caprae TaxID=2678566 RepID=A0A6N8FJ70_9BACI|nr:Ger(x)C family spore germination protein [Ornithinibacillus caprae]